MTLQARIRGEKVRGRIIFARKKDAYRAEKSRMADALIDQAERRSLPGLRKAVGSRRRRPR